MEQILVWVGWTIGDLDSFRVRKSDRNPGLRMGLQLRQRYRIYILQWTNMVKIDLATFEMVSRY